MGRLRTIGRRSFLVGSAAIMGGVAFGLFLMVQRPHKNPLEDGLGEGEVTFNPFIKITGNEIILVTPHADIGQGAAHVQATLIAEELDVELDQITLDFGQPSPAYFNTALGGDGVPFAAFDESAMANTFRDLGWSATKVLGVQGTVGSTTVPDQYEKLRAAGAVAREVLKLAAAEVAEVTIDQLTTENGSVVLPDGYSIAYTDLAPVAANITPPTQIELRRKADWRLIGKPMMRLDIAAKSTGAQSYGIDQTVNGMVHAAVRVYPRRTPLISYDATAAKAMRGVQQIVEVTNGVAVVADNTWRAIQAVNAIDMEFEGATYPHEMDAHWETLSQSFTEDCLNSQWRDQGDVEAALSGTAIEAEYRAPYVAHAPLEPLCAIIRINDDDTVDVWAGHQLPRFAQVQVANAATTGNPAIGVNAANVRFHNQYTGGSFGHRLEFEFLKLAAEIAAQLPGTPVKLTFGREEDFQTEFPRQIAMSRSKGSVKNGKVDAWALDICMPSVVASQYQRIGQPTTGPDTQITVGAWAMPYEPPSLRVRGYAASALAPISTWRSVGASSNGFFVEGFLDELIFAAGADPMEERLRLCQHELSRKVVEEVADLSNWGSDLGVNRGRGVALIESFGVPTAEVVEVTVIDGSIKIDKVYCVADVGTVVDPINIENQIQGGVVFGLGHAINSEVTFSDGVPEQTIYHAHEGMRLYQCPEIIVRVLENGEQIRGIGEPPVPPAAPALANAIFAATGQRLREMPFNKFIDFV